MNNGLMNTYGRLPVQFEHGQGCYLFDKDGNKYLDAISGIGVNALGHSHPALVKCLQEQAGKLLHTSNLYAVERQEAAAQKICDVTGMDRVFFCNSGAEANEAAIKLARLHGHNRGIERPVIIVMEGAFHGRTMATITASGNRKIQAGFEPLLSGFTRAPFGDIEALNNIARNNPDVCAILMEPIQGEGGINTTSQEYLQAARQLCTDNNWLFMLDEVQTGNGRCGDWFHYQTQDITPDVVATAKGIGGGLPIGACLAQGAAAEIFQPGNHGSTFGGNPLCCAAALTVYETIEAEKLRENAVERGQQILAGLCERIGRFSAVTAIRGQGLMIGIELDRNCGHLVAKALEKGLLINVTAGKVVRLLPPLIISEAEVESLLDGLCSLIEEEVASASSAA